MDADYAPDILGGQGCYDRQNGPAGNLSNKITAPAGSNTIEIV